MFRFFQATQFTKIKNNIKALYRVKPSEDLFRTFKVIKVKNQDSFTIRMDDGQTINTTRVHLTEDEVSIKNSIETMQNRTAADREKHNAAKRFFSHLWDH